ncbi:MAG: type II toxin-antitoxin system RelE/ParE family toxin [Planctomycetota bacterium]
MSVRIRLRPEAVDDLQQAADWYDEQGVPGLGRRFVLAVDEAMEALKKNPLLHPPGYRGVRQKLVAKFPYVVCYTAAREQVEVLAVMHAHRSPDAWRSR